MICEKCIHREVCGKYKATGGVDKCRDHKEEWHDRSLLKAIRMLEQEYERAKRLDFVRKPLAYALFHVWKKIDGGEG